MRTKNTAARISEFAEERKETEVKDTMGWCTRSRKCILHGALVGNGLCDQAGDQPECSKWDKRFPRDKDMIKYLVDIGEI